ISACKDESCRVRVPFGGLGSERVTNAIAAGHHDASSNRLALTSARIMSCLRGKLHTPAVPGFDGFLHRSHRHFSLALCLHDSQLPTSLFSSLPRFDDADLSVGSQAIAEGVFLETASRYMMRDRDRIYRDEARLMERHLHRSLTWYVGATPCSKTRGRSRLA